MTLDIKALREEYEKNVKEIYPDSVIFEFAWCDAPLKNGGQFYHDRLTDFGWKVFLDAKMREAERVD